MQYRTIPANGDELSILGFGCMRFPMKDGKIDEPRTIAQIRDAIDRGVNYFDTAWPYHAGESEPLLGKALGDGYRERVKIATKLPSWMVKSREDMDLFLSAQLEKLRTDHVDYYLVHSLNGPTWDAMVRLGVCNFLDRALRDGRIRNAGFSFHGKASDFPRIVDAYPWAFCQIQYNYLDENHQAGTEGLEYAAAKGLGVIVMEPLRGGNLAPATLPPAVAAIWDEAKIRRTPAEWALRWVWNRPEVTLLLSGMNDEDHIRENLAIADVVRPNTLTQEELDLVGRVARTYQELLRIGCTSCGYCAPCPSDVMIPECFEEFNKMHLFGVANEARFTYALRMGGVFTDDRTGYASQCVRCGECLDKCPQELPIPDLLAQVEAELEGPDLSSRVNLVRKMFRSKPRT